MLALLLALACQAPPAEPAGRAPVGATPEAEEAPLRELHHTDVDRPRWQPEDTAPPADPTVTEETIADWETPVFSDTEVMTIDIHLSEEAVAALIAAPSTYVEGSLTSGGHTWSPVGVRLKGSASWRPIHDKANWKIKFVDYTDERFYGLKRLTLNNNVWDPSMMAQDLAYRFFRAAGVPAPRTGYAWVTLNGEDKGLYTILESMDGQFVDREWPDSEGNLYEMTRSCDFTGDGSCYELQVEGDADTSEALSSAVAAADARTYDALREAFDWEDVLAFLATERVINHPDSYSYNLNNYFVYHDPVEDKVSLVPWGADSTFVYTYPPDMDEYVCDESAYLDVLRSSPVGFLGAFCHTDPDCFADLKTEMGRVADLLESVDLAGYAEANRERIRPYMEADPLVSYEPEHFESRVDCFVEWTGTRPDEIHTWLGF